MYICVCVWNGQLWSWRIGQLGNWRIGQLDSWNIGKLDNWRIGQLEYWKIGQLENWIIGQLENWIIGFVAISEDLISAHTHTYLHSLTQSNPKQPWANLRFLLLCVSLCSSVLLRVPSCTVVFLFVSFCCSSLPYRAAYCGVLLWSSPGKNGSESISRRAAHHGCSMGSNL